MATQTGTVKVRLSVWCEPAPIGVPQRQGLRAEPQCNHAMRRARPLSDQFACPLEDMANRGRPGCAMSGVIRFRQRSELYVEREFLAV